MKEKHLGRRYHLRRMAETAKASFSKFWNPEKECLFDVISEDGADPSLRPNQVIAAAIDFPILDRERTLTSPAGITKTCPEALRDWEEDRRADSDEVSSQFHVAAKRIQGTSVSGHERLGPGRVNSFLGFQGNQDLFLNIVAWLAEDADMISIRPKEPENQSLFLSRQVQQNVAWVALVIVPLFFVVAGVVTWWRRR